MNLDELLDATYQPKHIDQGSEAWEQIRCGRFTSSEIWKIMECGKREMTKAELEARPKKGTGSKTTLVPDPSKMSEKGMTYIYQKVAEVFTGRPKPASYAYPLVYGKETEPEAVEFYEKKFGIETEKVGFQPFTDHAGGSPDRLIGDKGGLEIKCPFSSENQVEYLMMTDRFDLKVNNPDYYWQVVTLLMFTGREWWDIGFFDPRMKDDRHKLHVLRILASEVQDEFDFASQALTGAVKMKLEIIQSLSIWRTQKTQAGTSTQ